MRALENRSYAHPRWQQSIAWFLTSQGITQVGSGLVQFALIWYVSNRTNSGSSLMVITIASFLPQLLIAMFAGVWADRFNRKWIINLADGGIALVTLLIAILFYRGIENVWLIYIISAVRSLGGGIQGPAITAAIPQLVPREQLVRVNGIQGTIGNLTQLLSPLLGGLALALLPMFGIFFIDVVTAALAITILIFIPFPKKSSPALFLDDDAAAPVDLTGADAPADSNWESLKEGIRYIRESRLVSVLMVVYAAFMFLLSPVIVLMPIYLKRNFGEEPWRLTVAQTSLFAGMVAGGLVVSWIGKFKRKLNVIQMAGVLIALAAIALGLLGAFRSPLFVIFGAIAFIAGFMVPFYTTNVTVLLQEETTPDRHGRVFAVLYMIGSAAIPAGMLLFGPLADIIPIEVILFIAGALQLAIVYASRRMLPNA